MQTVCDSNGEYWQTSPEARTAGDQFTLFNLSIPHSEA